MKLFLLSMLVAQSLGALLIPREKYLTHELFKDSDGRSPKCDDCCDNGVKLQHTIRFFGKDYKEFWPCANGVLSFDNEVREFTPKAFPQTKYPIVAAFWADVDLRRCRAADQAFCSYWTVLYGEDAKLLDAQLSNDFFKPPQNFRAKIAIVQSWDGVGYFELNDHKRNTFQIVVVSDGGENTFAGLYYDDIQWTTGDASDGNDGLGGTPAQMGFDVGDQVNFKAHPWSRTEKIIDLKNKQFIYKISNLKFCNAGEDLIDNKCTQLSCSIYHKNEAPGTPETEWGPLQYPIHQADGKGPTVGGKKNEDYVKPKNVDVGKCKKFLTETYYKEYVPSLSTCVLECAYEQNAATGVYNTYQPMDKGADTDLALTSTCKSATWSDKAALSCVEVGLIAQIKGSATEVQVRESTTTEVTQIQVKLKSKPFTAGNVLVVVQTSCKDGKPLKSRAAGAGTSDVVYYCNDDPKDPNNDPDQADNPAGAIATEPLAKFDLGTVKLAKNTLQFNNKNWDTFQLLKIVGVDNKFAAEKGFEEFTISVSVLGAADEDCKFDGCKVTKPYDSYEKTEIIKGRLVDNEGLELVAKGNTDENGGEATVTINPIISKDVAAGAVNPNFDGKKIKCVIDNTAEAKITGYKMGTGATQEMDEDGDGYVTFTKEELTFIITGQPDNVVDGKKFFQFSCELEDKNAGTLVPTSMYNEDVNIPGVIVDTTKSLGFTAPGENMPDGTKCNTDESKRANPIKMVDGCGRLAFTETTGSDTFTVRLATKPVNDVVITAQPTNVRIAKVVPDSVKFTSANWDKPQQFEISGAGDDDIFMEVGYSLGVVIIGVDGLKTTDGGVTKIRGSEVIQVYGYKNCFGARASGGGGGKGTTDRSAGRVVATAAPVVTAAPVATTTTTTTTIKSDVDPEVQKKEDDKRKKKQLKCFSFASGRLTGQKGTTDPASNSEPDLASLSLPVKIDDESTNWALIVTGAGVTAGAVIAVIIVILIIIAIVTALIAVAVKKKRAEEVERKDEMKKEADKAEGEIGFRMEEIDGDGETEDLESTAERMKAERDRLKEENENLASEVGEDALECADTDDPELLVGQIKSLKNENDRLREMQESRNNKRRKKKKKAEGFGQQQD